ncbi:MAG: DUF2231 domain-containing protein [Pyrinomonadaceae bacterium]
MLSGSRALGHAIPAELVVLPLGLLSTSVIFDFVHLIGGHTAFSQIAYWVILCGLIGGVAAFVFGCLDWLLLPSRSGARRLASVHLALYIIVLAIYGTGLYLRGNDPASPEIASTFFSTVGAGIALIGVTFGSEMYARTREPNDGILHIVPAARR